MKLKVVAETETFIETTNLKVGDTGKVVVEPPLLIVRTEKPSPAMEKETPLSGSDKDYFYYFFQSDFSGNRYHGKHFFIDNQPHSTLLNGEVPYVVSQSLDEYLPTFNKEHLSNKTKTLKDSPNDLALVYFQNYTFKKYNEKFYYFNPEAQEWRELNIKDYDSFNIMLSLYTNNYDATTKRAIMDSMIPYLFNDPTKCEHVERINDNLILFKNKRVLDISTMMSHPFSKDDFVFQSLDANWYDDDTDEYQNLMTGGPNKYFEALLKGVSGLRKDDDDYEISKRRHDDLLKYIGYTLTNEKKEQSTIIFYGTGRNGKTTLAEFIYNIKNSSFLLEIEKLLNDNFYAASFYDKRMLFIDELEDDVVDKSFIGKFKALTGKNILNVRPLQKESRDVKTNFVTYITTNNVHQIFFQDRALVRRIKIVNATKPAPEWANPKDNFTEGVNQQLNKDWVANKCIRLFVRECAFDISGLFDYDMKEWALTYNEIVKDLTKGWISIGLSDIRGNLTIRNDELIHLLLTSSGGLKQMLNNDKLNIKKLDDQVNILLINILNLRNTRSHNGYARYDGDVNKLNTIPKSGEWILIEPPHSTIFDIVNQVVRLHFRHIKTKETIIWETPMQQEFTFRYTFKKVFGWDGNESDSQWLQKTIAYHINHKTQFDVVKIRNSVCIYKPIVEQDDIIEQDNETYWFEEAIERINQIPELQVTKRIDIARAFSDRLTDKQIKQIRTKIDTEFQAAHQNESDEY